MSFCSFAEGAGMYDVTPVENMFLLEYLPTAPEGFLRVYLYVRMLCLHPELGGDLSELARVLNMEEDAVYNALSYWEHQGLVQRLTDRPPTYAVLPMRGEGAVPAVMDRDYYQYKEFNASLQALFGHGNLLHPKEYEQAADWLNLFGFTKDAVLEMVEAHLRRSRAKTPNVKQIFAAINGKVEAWAERGVRTREDVQRVMEYDGRVEKAARAVLTRLAQQRKATVDELELVRRWLEDWGFTQEDIIEACGETTKSRTPTLAYLNSVLESRRRGDDEGFDNVKQVLTALGASAKTPTPDQLRSYGAMLAQGFEHGTILLAAEQCSRKNKQRFEELEWMISKWAEMKLFRRDAAEAYVADMRRIAEEVRKLLEKCGSGRTPQLGDLELYRGWQEIYDPALIRYAAECAYGKQIPLRYMDRLLEKWQKTGVRTPEEAKAQHQAVAGAAAAANSNPALNYQQRSNTEQDYEGLLIDLNGGGNQ